MGLNLSVLDIGPIRSNQTMRDCVASMVDLAQHAEQLGFRRYWLAEHHNVAAVAASQTALLSALIGARTTSIRVGGCTLLAHYPPFLVAEQAAMLEACFTGRVDLGIGRSTGADWIASTMLRGGRRSDQNDDHPQSLNSLLAMLDPGGAHMDIAGEDYVLRAAPNAASAPPLWILGTSTYSARMAAELGLPYAFGYHITGEGIEQALDLYRENFRPSRHAAKPQVLVSAIVVVGDSDEEADRLARSQLFFMSAFRSGEKVAPQMLAEDAEKVDFPSRYDELVAMFRRTWIIGSPDRAAEDVATLARRLDIDEMMINPVGAAYSDQDPRQAPNRRLALSSLAERLLPRTGLEK